MGKSGTKPKKYRFSLPTKKLSRQEFVTTLPRVLSIEPFTLFSSYLKFETEG